MTSVSIPGLAAATAGALVGNTFSATLGLNQTQIGPPAIYGNISLQVQVFLKSKHFDKTITSTPVFWRLNKKYLSCNPFQRRVSAARFAAQICGGAYAHEICKGVNEHEIFRGVYEHA